MPPDALQPKAYCTNAGLQSFLLAPPGVSTRDPSSERRNYLGEKWPMNFASSPITKFLKTALLWGLKHRYRTSQADNFEFAFILQGVRKETQPMGNAYKRILPDNCTNIWFTKALLHVSATICSNPHAATIFKHIQRLTLEGPCILLTYLLHGAESFLRS